MANTQELNRRIGATTNTRKITRAMEMVAAAKLRRAQDRIQTLRPFAKSILELTARVAVGARNAVNHPLLEQREVKTVCLVVYTGDRGLAGALNANILKRALVLKDEWEAKGANVEFMSVGRRGGASLLFRGIDTKLNGAFEGITDSPRFRDAEEIAAKVIDGFRDAKFDHVQIIYNHFDSAISQTVITQDLLPLTDELLESALEGDEDSTEATSHTAAWEFEPSEDELLDRLLPTYVEQTCYRALLESTASEHGARMSAMRNATENAGEIIDALTLERNRVRQAAITQEILEIVAGADAL
ncbi:MAG: ATP synthase F1 subunit gamma [Thermoleophilia bacterium]|nr:ATP synthase F1 subunit gamma [Thermoleophilia bacterium]